MLAAVEVARDGGSGVISEMREAEVSRTRYGYRRLGPGPTLSESAQEKGGEPADSLRRQNLLPYRISLPLLATSKVIPSRVREGGCGASQPVGV